MTEKRICAVPGCGAALYSGNTSGVCRAHNHLKPYCMCIVCGGKGKPRYRVKTRAELQAEGLLPHFEHHDGRTREARRAKITLPPFPGDED